MSKEDRVQGSKRRPTSTPRRGLRSQTNLEIRSESHDLQESPDLQNVIASFVTPKSYPSSSDTNTITREYRYTRRPKSKSKLALSNPKATDGANLKSSHGAPIHTRSPRISRMQPSVLQSDTTDAASSPEPIQETAGISSVEVSDILMPPWSITVVSSEEDQTCEQIDIPPNEAYSYVVLPSQVKAVSAETATKLLRQIAGLTSICTKRALKTRDEMIKLRTEMDVTRRANNAEIKRLKSALDSTAKVNDAEIAQPLGLHARDADDRGTQLNDVDAPGGDEVLKVAKTGHKHVPVKHTGFSSDSEDCAKEGGSPASWPSFESDESDMTDGKHVHLENVHAHKRKRGPVAQRP